MERECYRLRKQLEDLSVAHQALVQAMAERSQRDTFGEMLREAWTEIENTPKVYLTPAFHEREGVEEA